MVWNVQNTLLRISFDIKQLYDRTEAIAVVCALPPPPPK